MKRRGLLWFVASIVLALLAGVMAMFFLSSRSGPAPAAAPKQPVVVALNAIAANQVIRADNVKLEERDKIQSGAAMEVQAIVGATALRDIAQGEQILMQDLRVVTG